MKHLLFFLFFAASFALARATDYTLPVITSPAPASAGPAGWISNFYQFALMGVGLLAFGIIVYAGFKYALNPGGHSAQSDAKEMISQALLGLLLLLGAYIILRTINPQLVSLPTEFGLERLEGAREAGDSTKPNYSGGNQCYKCSTIAKDSYNTLDSCANVCITTNPRGSCSLVSSGC